MLARAEDDVFTRTDGMDCFRPTRDKRRRNSKRSIGQSAASDYHPASASSRVSPRSGASESDQEITSKRDRVSRETPSPLPQSGVQSGESTSDRGAESMAQYVATPTFSGRAADSPIERAPHQKEGHRNEDQDIEEPRPWRLGAPYYRSGQPGGNVLPGHPGQLVVHPPPGIGAPIQHVAGIPNSAEYMQPGMMQHGVTNVWMTYQVPTATPGMVNPQWNSPASSQIGWLSRSSSSSSDNRQGTPVHGNASGYGSNGDSPSGGYVPFLPTPTPKKEARILNERTVRGDRIRGIAEGRRLRSRLDEDMPEGP